MDLTPRIPGDRQLINSYGNGGFQVSGKTYRGSLLVFPDHVVSWPFDSMAKLTSDSLAPVWLASPKVELLFLGCGPSIAFVPSEIRATLRQHGIALEPVDTGAAARTYNVLMGEGRRVAAALIAID